MKRLFAVLLFSIIINSPLPVRLRPIYTQYKFSQGLHEHAAFDIMGGGRNEPIYAPIGGSVVYRYTSATNGNTVLIIENDDFRITLIHGRWIVEANTKISQGQIIGYEYNYGQTFKGGKFCGTGSNCGWHTHIRAWDKVNKAPVNLMEVW